MIAWIFLLCDATMMCAGWGGRRGWGLTVFDGDISGAGKTVLFMREKPANFSAVHGDLRLCLLVTMHEILKTTIWAAGNLIVCWGMHSQMVLPGSLS